MPRQRLDLRLPPEQVAEIDRRASEAGITRTLWIERACDYGLGFARSSPPIGPEQATREELDRSPKPTTTKRDVQPRFKR